MDFLLLGLGTVVAGALGALTTVLARYQGEVDLESLRHGPTTPIRDVADGKPAKITGRVRLAGGGLPNPSDDPRAARASKGLVAPGSGRACACYRIVVSDTANLGFIVEMAGGEFLLDDDGGTALIDARRPTLYLLDEARATVIGRGDPAALAPLLERKKQKRLISLLEKPGRVAWVESIVPDGAIVSVVGFGRWENDPHPRVHPGYRDIARRLVMRSRGPGSLIVSDEV